MLPETYKPRQILCPHDATMTCWPSRPTHFFKHLPWTQEPGLLPPVSVRPMRKHSNEARSSSQPFWACLLDTRGQISTPRFSLHTLVYSLLVTLTPTTAFGHLIKSSRTSQTLLQSAEPFPTLLPISALLKPSASPKHSVRLCISLLKRQDNKPALQPCQLCLVQLVSQTRVSAHTSSPESLADCHSYTPANAAGLSEPARLDVLHNGICVLQELG